MRAVLSSFRVLTAAEAQATKPLQLRIVSASEGDTPATLAARMATHERAFDLFLLLNGLDRNSKLTPGQRYKIVAE